MLIQRQAPGLRHLTSAHLAQTMTLLELSTVELKQKIEAELSRNPALELLEEKRCPGCGRILPGNRRCIWCTPPAQTSPDQPIIFTSAPQDFYSHSSSKALNEDHESQDADYIQEEIDLSIFVMRQIAPELLKDERAIAAHILTALDEDGLLSIQVSEIAQYHHVSMAKVQQVLHLIQHADPVGVGSPTSQDALLIQLEMLAENQPVPSMAVEAVKAGLELLSYHRLPDLAHALQITRKQARDIYQFITANLNPFPGRTHWGEHYQSKPNHAPKAYYSPDICISRLSEDEDSTLIVEVALPLSGRLRINPLFREALQQAPPEKEEQWKKDFEQANLLVKCLQQRSHTLVRMMEKLAVLQRRYILRGDEHLLPVTRAHLALELGLHESTISRAVAEKSVQLPNGHIVPLAKFFDRSLHIRTAVRQIISSERSPLSDTEIVSLLAGQGYQVARRTVAKYRSMEGILPAHLRVRIAA